MWKKLLLLFVYTLLFPIQVFGSEKTQTHILTPAEKYSVCLHYARKNEHELEKKQQCFRQFVEDMSDLEEDSEPQNEEEEAAKAEVASSIAEGFEKS